MRLIDLSIISLVIMGLTACSTPIGEKYGFLKDETRSYQRERPMEPTVILPQNLSSKNMQDYYEVPQPGSTVTASTQLPLIAPPGSNLARSSQPIGMTAQDRIRSAENAKIQGHTMASRTEPQIVGANFSQTWTKVGHLLQASDYKIVEKDSVLGTYFVVDTQGTGGKVKKDMPIYQVHLRNSSNGTLITVSPSNAGLQDYLNKNLK